MPQPRLVIPQAWRKVVFNAVHDFSHPDRKPSQYLIAAKFIWRGIKMDVGCWVKTYVACQCGKVHHHVKAPLEQFTVPERGLDHVNMDLVGPPFPSRGYAHLLTMVDRTTKWPGTVPLSKTTAADAPRAFNDTWVSRFEVPTDLSSDRGAQFMSELWT